MKRLPAKTTTVVLFMLMILCSTRIIGQTTDSNSQVNTSACTINGHQYVDLGLPSGTLWATCNIGAQEPMSYGNYYFWGETSPKVNIKDYVPIKHKYSKPNPKYQKKFAITKYCFDDSHGNVDRKLYLDSQDDAAYVNWGDCWCMPTKQQFEELLGNCQVEREESNNGMKFTGHNGNVLYLPFSGMIYQVVGAKESSLESKGEASIYWTNGLYNDYYAYAYSTYTGRVDQSVIYNGCSVRPVVSSKGKQLVEQSQPVYPNTENDRQYGPFNKKTYYLDFPTTYFRTCPDELAKKFNQDYPGLKYTQHLYDEAMKGDDQAQFLLGYCYYKGLGVSADRAQAIDILKKGVENLSGPSLSLLFALDLVSDPASISGFDAIEGVYEPAQAIKVMYETRKLARGRSLEDNMTAKQYFLDNMKKIADKKYPEAMYLYGSVADDINYLDGASKLGLPEASNACAYYYAQRNKYAKAFSYFQDCKSKNYPVSEADYNYVRRSYFLNSKNAQKLGTFLKESYENGDYDTVKQGLANAESKGVTSDDIEIISALFKRDKGTSDEAVDANTVLLKYAESGNVLAQEQIANSYKSGKGMPSVDMSKAFQWYKTAARNGSKNAQDYLKGRNITW